MNQFLKFSNSIFFVACLIVFTSCLKTRKDIGTSYSSSGNSLKSSDSVKEKSLDSDLISRVEEKDELIRALNGRVETLEGQIAQLKSEVNQSQQLKQSGAEAQSQKLQVFQEALVKLESQMTQLDSDLRAELKLLQSQKTIGYSSKNENQGRDNKITNLSGQAQFDLAQEFFAKKDFKNAILEYQKFIDVKNKTKLQKKLIPEAMYKIALCFEALGLKDEAQPFYEDVASQFPSSEFGKKAKAKTDANKTNTKKKK